jgi:hypothetical protein
MRLAMMLAVILAVIGLLTRGLALAADPDFSSVTDILSGQRLLLRDDDVVLTVAFFPGNDSLTTQNLLLQTSSSSFSGVVPSTASVAALNATAVTATAVGRMFNLPRNVIVTLAAAQNQSAAPALDLTLTDPQSLNGLDRLVPTQVQPTGFFSQQIAMADFNGDGYAEVLLSYANLDGPGQGVGMAIASAANVEDMFSGLKWGPEFHPSVVQENIAVGDFNGDGRPEIVSFDGQTITLYTVAPTTLAIAPVTSLQLDISLLAGFSALAAGRFRDATHDDLIVVASDLNDQQAINIISIAVDSSLKPTLAALSGLDTGIGNVVGVMAASAQLNFFAGPTGMQLVIGTATTGGSILYIGSFDANLNFLPQNVTNTGDGCLNDVAIGNFDNRNADGSRNPNLQIATLYTPKTQCGDQGQVNIALWAVDLTNQLQLTQIADFFPPSEPSPQSIASVAFAVGDTQGRELLLGPPEKVTILADIQPDIVLGIPPMHIDYIRDVDNLGPDGKPAVLNLTVMPSVPAPGTGFSTQYNFSSSTSTSASRNSTTSYSTSVKKTFGGSVGFAIPDIGGISDDVKVSLQHTHESTVSSTYNTYVGTTDSLQATTGFADHLFYTTRRLNLYFYPIIGQTVCPKEQPNCPDSEKLPLYVQFSGPDEISHNDIDATTQEWYQPVWEPGNVFSYPWNLAQLQQMNPSLTPLTTDPAPWRGTDSSETAYITTWTQDVGQSQSSGSVSTFSVDKHWSFSENVFGGTGESVSFDLSQSTSISTLNTVEQTLSTSTGIQVNKPEFSDTVAGTYLYDFAGYVLGLTSSPDTLQTINLQDQQGQPIDIQSAGPLLVAFSADPLREGLPWWTQSYTLPDVGLNHPERWDWAKSTQTASFNAADPKSPALDQPFYHIKGFFILAADANGAGPNLSIVAAGDQLVLQVRVYNYSLVDTDPRAPIHVRFYGQRHNQSTRQLAGNSFLIGEEVLASIPGFKSQTTQGTVPNWALAGTTFDTTGFDNTYLVFWVVVWMENASGNLVPEIEGHGLTANPGSMTFAQITDVPVAAYSNNVGFYGYNTPLFIAPQSGVLAATASEAGSLVIEHITVPTEPLLLDQKALVNAQLRTDENRSGPILVAFYDGDPQHGGKAFDFHHISHVRANDTYLSKGIFRPQTCGEHTIFVVAGPASAAPATAKATVQVALIPEDLVEALISSTARLDLPTGAEVRLLAKLEGAKKAFQHSFPHLASNRLKTFIGEAEVQRGDTLTDQQADLLIGLAKQIIDCV